MGFARHVANRVVFMANGVIDAQGNPAELFEGLPTERFRQFVSSHQQRNAQ
jgi:octopine/nopaline transport system ATP-binding protein